MLTALLTLGAADVARAAGCSKDTDCKGERICEDGTCVSPGRGSSGSEATSRPTMGGGAATVCYTNVGPCPLVMPLRQGTFCQCYGPYGAFAGIAQ